jgi:hypothetical protein
MNEFIRMHPGAEIFIVLGGGIVLAILCGVIEGLLELWRGKSDRLGNLLDRR